MEVMESREGKQFSLVRVVQTCSGASLASYSIEIEALPKA
jgi:hypothetical protein